MRAWWGRGEGVRGASGSGCGLRALDGGLRRAPAAAVVAPVERNAKLDVIPSQRDVRAVGPAAGARERYVRVSGVVGDDAVEADSDVGPRVEPHVLDGSVASHSVQQAGSVKRPHEEEIVLEDLRAPGGRGAAAPARADAAVVAGLAERVGRRAKRRAHAPA